MVKYFLTWQLMYNGWGVWQITLVRVRVGSWCDYSHRVVFKLPAFKMLFYCRHTGKSLWKNRVVWQCRQRGGSATGARSQPRFVAMFSTGALEEALRSTRSASEPFVVVTEASLDGKPLSLPSAAASMLQVGEWGRLCRKRKLWKALSL